MSGGTWKVLAGTGAATLVASNAGSLTTGNGRSPDTQAGSLSAQNRQPADRSSGKARGLLVESPAATTMRGMRMEQDQRRDAPAMPGGASR